MVGLQPGERARIRQLLGFPDMFRYANTRLESVMSNVSDEGIDQIRAILTRVAEVDTLISTTGVANLGLKRVDEIWFQDGVTQISQQRKAGRTYIGQLSILLGVPPYGDYYGSAGYPGDSFSGLGGGGNGTRFFPLG